MATPPPSPSHYVGFDGLRLLAAVGVIFSHAFLIATRKETDEPLVRLLGEGNIIGLYGVFTFFIISGFLLTRSLTRNSSPLNYVVNRVCRIVPGFSLSVLVLAFIVGPLISVLPARAYFSSEMFSQFIFLSLDTFSDLPLPGLFSYATDHMASSTNGSLWSLHYEIMSYVLLFVVWTVFRSHKVVTLILGTMAVLVMIPRIYDALPSVAYTLPYFAGGALLYWFQERNRVDWRGAAVSLVALIVAAVFDAQVLAFAIFGAYLIIFFGGRPNIGSWLASRVGDCSYGLYLYGWPAEQVVKQLTNTSNPWILFLMAFPIALAMAVFSFHAVEKRAMRHRAKVSDWIRNLSASLFKGEQQIAWRTAKLVLVVGAGAVLVSKGFYWYILRSLGTVAAVGIVVALFAASVSRWVRSTPVSKEVNARS